MIEDNNLQISDIKKKPFHKKKGLIFTSLICLIALVLGVVFIPKGIKVVSKSTHPLLPFEIKFGMTLEEYYQKDAKAKTMYTDCNKFADKYYSNFDDIYYNIPCNDDIEYKLFSKINSKHTLSLSFDGNQKLYELSVEINYDKEFEKNWDYICGYYRATFGKEYSESDWGSLLFSDEKNTVVLDVLGENNNILIDIMSSEYEAVTHEVSQSAISSGFNSITYKYNDTAFGMNLKKLLDLCVENQKIYYDKLLPSDLTEFEILNEQFTNKNSDYYKYASTSYIVTVHGDVSEIAGYPLVDEDVDVVDVLLVFDEYDNLKAYKIIKEHKNLGTYFASYTFW